MYWDLSHPIESGMPVYPGDQPVAIEQVEMVDDEGVSVHRLFIGTHSGTHIDAPSHALADGRSLGDLAVDQFAFDAMCIDVTPCTPHEAIASEQLPATVPESVDLLLIHTGWDQYWDDPQYFEYPIISPEAAGRLCDLDCGIGLDTPSPDPIWETPEETTLPVHRRLLSNELAIIENLRGLDALPQRINIFAFPLPIDADGAPVRAVARTHE